MPKISVIVPIYGTERYIERCAHSLFRQTMPDLEFIFVNDCTPDASIKLLQSVINQYPYLSDCVKIVNHECNLGLPYARQSGLRIASGDFILHCDSDDWLESNCCEVVYDVACKENADVVVYKNWIDSGETRWEDNSYDDTDLADEKLAMSSAISLKSSPYVWNKLVRRKMFDNPIVFPKKNLAEDWVMSVQYAYYSNKTVCLDERLYHYCMNANSIMRTSTKEACFKRCADEHANVSLICDWLQEVGLSDKYKHEIVKRKTVTKNQLIPVLDDAQARSLWRRTFSEINIPVIFSSHFDRHCRVQYMLLITGLYKPYKYIRSKFN